MKAKCTSKEAPTFHQLLKKRAYFFSHTKWLNVEQHAFRSFDARWLWMEIFGCAYCFWEGIVRSATGTRFRSLSDRFIENMPNDRPDVSLSDTEFASNVTLPGTKRTNNRNNTNVHEICERCVWNISRFFVPERPLKSMNALRFTRKCVWLCVVACGIRTNERTATNQQTDRLKHDS